MDNNPCHGHVSVGREPISVLARGLQLVLAKDSKRAAYQSELFYNNMHCRMNSESELLLAHQRRSSLLRKFKAFPSTLSSATWVAILGVATLQ